MKPSSSVLPPLSCPPLPHVRIGMVGVGQRGLHTLQRYAQIADATITVLADLDDTKLQAAQQVLTESHRPPAKLLAGENAWKALCQHPDVDVVYICTDWTTHARIAIETMLQGKHAAIEVPAAVSIEECWQLVETAERTRRHCFMTENCCYDPFALAQLEMAEKGVLGAITHAEGAYFHDLRHIFHQRAQQDKGHHHGWMESAWQQHPGNPYPTHGIGPIGWLLGLHRGDCMTALSSMTTQGAPSGAGKTNSTLIRTALGRTILLQINLTTPQPYSRRQTVMGSEGYASKYPTPTIQLSDMAQPLTGAEAEHFAERYLTSPAAQCVLEGQRRQVENAMNYAMDRRFIYCLRHGLPLDIDVYDAAEWSCLTEQTARSSSNGGQLVEVPDFTRGRWEQHAKHIFYT